jgi:hypothetical protein
MQRRYLASLAAGIVLAALPARAHHAFAAEFDETKPVKLQGKITKVELINPHSWFHIDVKNPDGTTTSWMVEGGSPNALFRLGFKQSSVPVGAEIVIEGYQAKDGANRAVGKDFVFPDGKRLFLGGSAPGADGKQ